MTHKRVRIKLLKKPCNTAVLPKKLDLGTSPIWLAEFTFQERSKRRRQFSSIPSMQHLRTNHPTFGIYLQRHQVSRGKLHFLERAIERPWEEVPKFPRKPAALFLFVRAPCHVCK